MLVEANGHGVVADVKLNSVERADEFLLMGLRLAEGIDPARYTALSGTSFDENTLSELSVLGLIESKKDRISVSKQGFMVLNGIISRLLGA